MTLTSGAPVKRIGERDISVEDLLRAVYLRSDNPVFLVGFRERTILACTPQVERVFGYKPSELLGETTECLHASHEQFVEFGEMSEPLLEREMMSFHGRFRMKRKDGSLFPSEHFVTLIRDTDGEPVAAVSVVHDLSRIEESADTLPDSALHLTAIAGEIPGGIFQRIHTRDGRMYYSFLRGTLLKELGVDPVEAQRDPEVLLGRMAPQDRERYRRRVEEALETMTPVDMLLRFPDTDKGERFIRSMSQPHRLDDGSVAWDGMFFDMTTEKYAEESLRYITYHDALTGLPNLVAFREHLEAVLGRIEREGNRVIVAGINLRRFRIINETLGHDAGDLVIKGVGERLRERLHEEDFLARFHNDEFLVLIDDVEPGTEMGTALNGLLSVFDDPLEIPGLDPISLDARIGLTVAPQDGDAVDELLRNADTALQHSRRESGSSVEFYRQSMTSDLLSYLELERALEAAIEAGEIEPFLQPQYEIRGRNIIGMEALARWKLEGEWISPGRFIPVAEDSGLIVALGRQILASVIETLQAWKRQGRRLVPVSVNFSTLQFRDPEFSSWLLETLDESGLGRSAIQVEITESVFMDDIDAATRLIEQLHREGIDFNLDDFGTGFSSLSYLSRLPFSVLKIDTSFTRRILEDRRSANLVHSIIQMAEALDLDVIAEGVETEEQLSRLREMGCKAVQGFLTGRPMPLDEAGELLQSDTSA